MLVENPPERLARRVRHARDERIERRLRRADRAHAVVDPPRPKAALNNLPSPISLALPPLP